MKSSETLREIRDSLGTAPSSQGETTADLGRRYQSILTQAHAAIVELQEALASTDSEGLRWASRLDVAFMDVNEVLAKLERAMPDEPPAEATADTTVGFRHIRRCILGFRRAEAQWQERAPTDVAWAVMIHQAVDEWNSALEILDPS